MIRPLPRLSLFTFVAIVLMLMIGMQWMLFVEQRRHVRESREWVDHTIRSIGILENMFGKLRDSELGQRGYLITGFEETLNPHFAVTGGKLLNNSPANMGNYDTQTLSQLRVVMRASLGDDRLQLERFGTLEDLIDQKLEQNERLIRLRRERGSEVAQAQARTEHTRYLMKRIRQIMSEMIAVENRLLIARTEKDARIDETLMHFILISALFAYGGLIATLIMVLLNARRAQHAERQLRLKEDLFRAVAEMGLDAFFLFKKKSFASGQPDDLLLEYANPVACDMAGKKKHALIDRPLREIFPEQGEGMTKYYLDLQQQGVAYQHESCTLSGPWAGRSLQNQIIPLAEGIAILARDITEQKKMERMKNEFVSTVSHELRTPLTSIRGSLGLILGGVTGPVAEQATGLLWIAHNNCERLVRLINDILDIEKIEAGSMNFHCRPQLLIPFLHRAIEANAAYAEKHRIRLQLETENIDTAQINADADRLMQIITNLLSNAIKFSHETGVVILRCRPMGAHVRIEVEDSGQGIPLAFQPFLFGRFMQGDGSDTRQKGGTGLGLSIVKAMTERMGGTVHFHSTEGEGSRFWLTFPLLSAPPLIVESTADTRPCILICEDDADVAQFLSMVLDRAGFATDIAPDAGKAMECLERRDYAGMTLDLLLPDTYGVEFLTDLRANPRFALLPILVVSARAEQERHGPSGSKAMDWIDKPIDTARLVAHLRGLVSGKLRPRILHVEDDDGIAEIIRMALPEADVVRVATIKEATAHLRESFDLVVLDIGLPDGSGVDLLPLLQNMPVVLFTAGEITPYLHASVDASLVKSRTSDRELVETIRTLIARDAKFAVHETPQERKL